MAIASIKGVDGMARVCFVLFSILSFFAISSVAGPKEDILRFKQVVKPYTDEYRIDLRRNPLRYPNRAVAGRKSGTFNQEGEIVSNSKQNRVHDYIDCSCFASGILHRMLHDGFSDFNVKVQQGWGDEIARHYQLNLYCNKTVNEFIHDISSGEIPNGVYFFDIRNAKGVEKKIEEGGRGHVGFLIAETQNKNPYTQIHMSSLKSSDHKEGGLMYDREFAAFLNRSLYGKTDKLKKTSRISLYRVTAK